MFDIAWSEMAVIALVALVVIGPKDLPKVMKQVTFWVRKARHLAAEFQSGIDEIVREAELDEAKKAIEQLKTMDVNAAIEKTVDPTGSLRAELNTPLDPEKAADEAIEPPIVATPALPEPSAPLEATVPVSDITTPAREVAVEVQDGSETSKASSGST